MDRFFQPRCTARSPRRAVRQNVYLRYAAASFSRGGQAPLDFLGIDAVGKADIALDTEGVAGDEEQVILPCPETEGVGILFQRFREDVKCTAGALHLKAQLGELIVQQVHVRLVHAQVAGDVQTAAHGPLDDAGRAVVAGEAGDLGHHVHQHILALTARTHRHITKTLAGQAQALGVGKAGESVGVEGRRVGHLFAVECDIPVGLIADKEDVVAECLALLGQDLCHTGERPGRVDHTGGVVGGIDEHTRRHLLG